MKRSIIAVALAMSGCASYQPIVDMQGVDRNAYQRDLVSCQQYADQVNPAAHAAAGAAAGAVLGAAVGAIFGNRSTAKQGAGLYGLLGASGGGAEGANAQRQIVMRCMTGRGYKVLY